jgi:hypothetical protein
MSHDKKYICQFASHHYIRQFHEGINRKKNHKKFKIFCKTHKIKFFKNKFSIVIGHTLELMAVELHKILSYEQNCP